MMSVPGMAGDPCKQNFPDCVALSGKAIATCDATGTWGQCNCITPTTGSTLNPQVSSGPMCGNGKIEGTEECEQGMIPAGMTCQTLKGPTAIGLVQCLNCKVDFNSCMLPTPVTTTMMPTAGMGPTGGAGH